MSTLTRGDRVTLNRSIRIAPFSIDGASSLWGEWSRYEYPSGLQGRVLKTDENKFKALVLFPMFYAGHDHEVWVPQDFLILNGAPVQGDEPIEMSEEAAIATLAVMGLAAVVAGGAGVYSWGKGKRAEKKARAATPNTYEGAKFRSMRRERSEWSK